MTRLPARRAPRRRAAVRTLLGAAGTLAAALPGALGAQGVLDATARAAPVFTTYRVGGAAGATVRQVALPVAVVIPVAERLTVDLATAYVSSEATGGRDGGSRIAGLTDTQLRASYTLGDDAIVVTAGLNLPTGRYGVAEEQIEAAGRIGSDFLLFPVSSMGDGAGVTAGVAAARPVGRWSVGLAASARKSGTFDAFEVEEGTVRFRPADEYRLRLGAGRVVGDGRLALGLTYSAFGRDAAGPTTYGTGDRIIGQAAWAGRARGVELMVDAWSVHHAAGEVAGGRAPAENVADVAVAVRLPFRRASVEPLVGLRHWMRDGASAGALAQLGARARVPLPWGLVAFPALTVARGEVDPEGGGRAVVRGLQSSLAVRWMGW